jgi:hypothetical protein
MDPPVGPTPRALRRPQAQPGPTAAIRRAGDVAGRNSGVGRAAPVAQRLNVAWWGILALLLCGFLGFGGPLAVVLGYVSRRKRGPNLVSTIAIVLGVLVTIVFVASVIGSAGRSRSGT